MIVSVAEGEILIVGVKAIAIDPKAAAIAAANRVAIIRAPMFEIGSATDMAMPVINLDRHRRAVGERGL